MVPDVRSFQKVQAIITSANLTEKAFTSNIEVGVELNGDEAKLLIDWFDRLWESASPLTVSRLSELKRDAEVLRRDYVKLKEKAYAKLRLLQKHLTPDALSDDLQDLFSNAKNFFVCNSDRRHDKKTSTGGYVIEQEMYNRGLAAAWESFNYPGHMKTVEPGDAIFMFAKGVGVIGIGRASRKCEVISWDSPDRIRTYVDGETSPEWRVPVQWLTWTDDAGAYRWKSPNCTFWNVNDSRYDDFRDAVRSHFLRDI